MPLKKYWPLVLLFSFALLIRLAFVPNPGFEADVAFWKGWGLAAADKGAVWSMLNTNNNYPTPFSYQLGAMVSVYRLLGGNPHDFTSYWANDNARFLFASKLWPIAADVGIALIFLFIGRNPKRFGFPKDTSPILYTAMAAIYLFNPVSIIDGAWWGQVDSVGVVLFLLCFLAVARKKLLLAGFLFTLAMMTKLQNMIYGPLLFVFIWQQYGFRSLLYTLGGALIGFFGLNIEFFLSQNKGRVIASLIDNFDYFPYMSLHAYNIWWIVSGGNGMGVSDKLLFLGILNAQQVGLILFSASYLLSVLMITLPTFIPMLFGSYKKITEEKDPTFSSLQPLAIERLFLGLSVVNLGFFLLLTQSHERYAFPVIAFSLCLIPFLNKTRRVIFITSYCILSVLYFYNLHTAFAVNYPNNVFQFLKGWWITAVPTTAVSYIFMLSFVLLFVFFRKTITPLPIVLALLFSAGMLIKGNLPYIQGTPMQLTSFKPWYSAQQFARPVEDMPVNGGYGPKSWTWLSTQYVFYRKGIGTHANSELRYDLQGKFRKFTTDFGIDTTAGTQASSIFEIWGDGKQLFVSEKMGRFDMPKHASVDITGVKTLALIVRDAGDSNRDDHANWLNPKLYR